MNRPRSRAMSVVGWMLIGLFVGLVSGFLIGRATYVPPQKSDGERILDFFLCGCLGGLLNEVVHTIVWSFFGMSFGAGAGAILGALLGRDNAAPPTERTLEEALQPRDGHAASRPNEPESEVERLTREVAELRKQLEHKQAPDPPPRRPPGSFKEFPD